MDKDTIKELVSNYFNLDITRKTRKKEYVEARAFYYRLMRQYTRLSLQEIGSSVNRDHASVLHGMKSLYNWMQTDRRLKNNYNVLNSQIKSLEKESEVIDIDQNIVLKYVQLKDQVKEQSQIIKELTEELQDLKARTDKREKFYAKYGFVR